MRGTEGEESREELNRSLASLQLFIKEVLKSWRNDRRHVFLWTLHSEEEVLHLLKTRESSHP